MIDAQVGNSGGGIGRGRGSIQPQQQSFPPNQMMPPSQMMMQQQQMMNPMFNPMMMMGMGMPMPMNPLAQFTPQDWANIFQQQQGGRR